MPSVSLVCEGFERQASATARGLGFDGLPLAVLRGHVDAQTTDEMVAAVLEHTVPQVIAGLTTAIDHDALGDGTTRGASSARLAPPAVTSPCGAWR